MLVPGVVRFVWTRPLTCDVVTGASVLAKTELITALSEGAERTVLSALWAGVAQRTVTWRRVEELVVTNDRAASTEPL